MGKQIDMKGQRFGRLVANIKIGSDGCGRSIWECDCDCGKKTAVVRSNLVGQRIKSCGCLRKRIALPLAVIA